MENLKINIKKILLVLSAIFATYGVEAAYNIGQKQVNEANKFINVIILIIMIYVYKKIEFNLKNKRTIIILTIISALFSLIVIIGGQLEYNGEIIWNFVTLLQIISLTFSIYPVIYFIFEWLEKSRITINECQHIWIKSFIPIFLCGILGFLAVYPGVYGYDAGFQIMEFFKEDVQLTSHFSIIYSAILSGIVYLGKILFNSYQTGFAIYSFLQMTFLSYVSSKVCMFCVKRLKNKYLFYLSILFYCIYPLYMIITVSSCQDAIFGGLFTLITLNLIKLVEEKKYFEKKSNIVLLVLEVFLLCLFRNNGIYCILFVIIILLFIKIPKKYIVVCCMVFSIILVKIVTGPLYNYLNVYNKSPIQEMSSIPSQQLARVYAYNKEVYSQKDLIELNKCYDVDGFKYYIYNQSISDASKASINVEYVKSNLTNYLSLWLKIGLKDPKDYVEAFLLNNLGLWYPNKNYYDSRMYHPYVEYKMLDAKAFNENYIEITRDSKFELYNNLLQKILVDNYWEKFPVISTLFTSGTYFLIFVFLVFFVVYKRNYNLFIPISFIAGLYITLFLAPVSLFRYNFSICMIIPIMISLILKNKVNKDN